MKQNRSIFQYLVTASLFTGRCGDSDSGGGFYRRLRLACAMCATSLLVLFGFAPRAAAEPAVDDACFEEVAQKLTSPYALLSVRLDAQHKKPVYTFERQAQCETGKCTHVFMSHDQAALPKTPLAGVKPDTMKTAAGGACAQTPAYFVSYLKVPASADKCEAAIISQSPDADVVVLVANNDLPARVLRAAECPDAGCTIRYLSRDTFARLPRTAVEFLTDAAPACGGGEQGPRYVDVAPSTTPGTPPPVTSASLRQEDALTEYRTSQPFNVSLGGVKWEASFGSATAVSTSTGAAGEVLQILGQIVVDRATEAAYQRARDEILRLLACPHADKRKDVSFIPQLGTKIKFSRACRVMQSLRLQELAMSRSVLIQALLEDVLAAMLKLEGARPAPPPGPVHESGEMPPGAAQTTPPDVLELLLGNLLPELSRVSGGGSSGAPGALVWQLVQGGLEHAGKAIEKCGEDNACKAVALASVAVIRCRTDAVKATADARATVLRACTVEDYVEQLAGHPSEYAAQVVATAKTIASGWMQAQTAVTAEGAPDHRTRARAAVNTAFEVGCLWLNPKELQSAKCPAELDPREDAALNRRVVSVVRLLLVAAIDGDTNTVVAGLGRGVDLVLEQLDSTSSLDARETKGLRRGLRLLGAVLQYAETFAKTGTKDDAQTLHERRTKILESLTREMTDRIGREEDDIFSLGGSLRAVAGFRFDPGGVDPTFLGPVSLPLGIGYQSAGHVHVEIGLFDVGQYISYQNGPTGVRVREPEPADVLSPSLTVGGHWGKSFPIFLGLTVGYSPQYAFSADATDAAGSINLGITTGVYVPLFDLN